MVINIGELKAGNLSYVEDEIRRLKKIASDRILKVIIETCLLTEEEKVIMCKIVSAAGADFIKTSTGFSKSGATREDIALFKANIAEGVKMKAAGGIRTLADAEDYLNLGCERLGTSAIVKIVKQESGETTY
ncbi:MAG TPA: deoxyribose-phosphate aldolase, partial [Eubacteriales bacterium]|nr:deoxyribose-phosphate aldolase [Eubacteriales bacterium]